MRRPRSSLALAPLFSSLLLGCGASPAKTGAEPVEVAAMPALPATRCGAATPQPRPLVVALPAGDRLALEAQARSGLVVVHYDGCSIELLRQCRAPGGYDYHPHTRQDERVSVRNEGELWASMPVRGAELAGILGRAGQIDLAMTLVGSWEAQPIQLARADLEGPACEEATHVLSALTAGAFELTAGAGAARQVLDGAGAREACGKAGARDAAPPFNCGALLQVEAVPLDDEGAVMVGDPSSGVFAVLGSEGGSVLGALGALSAGAVPHATDIVCPSAQRFTPGVGCQAIPAPAGTHICSTALTPAAFQECKAQCAAGNPGSCTNLGFLHEKGVGGPKDDKRAATYYRKACEGGDPQGCKNYGYVLQHGQGVPTDERQARAYYDRGCREGNASACVDLGFFAQNGKGGAKDELAAATYYRKACDGDYALGCANLGRSYANGWGVPLDYDHAYRTLEKACNLGEVEACSDWGNLLVLGRGGRSDRARGIELLRKGCAGGNQWGCDRLLEYGEVP